VPLIKCYGFCNIKLTKSPSLCQAANKNEDTETHFIMKTSRQDFTACDCWAVRNMHHIVSALQSRTAIVHVLPADYLGKINSTLASCNYSSPETP
jgi:hypothetical protein